MNKQSLVESISPPLDQALATQLLNEFESIERRYVLRDWEPATLDAGQFTEAAARLLYHIDSKKLDRRREVGKCLEYVEDPDGKNCHAFPERKSAKHLSKVMRTIYKFRSDRGAVHIDPQYSANQLDSRMVLENARWILSELLRIFWNGNRSEVATHIRSLIEFDVPAVGVYEDTLLVQRTDCSAEEEILILLHHAGEVGLSRKQLGQYISRPAPRVTKALASLTAIARREVIKLSSGNYRLTDLGIKCILTDLGEKLLLPA